MADIDKVILHSSLGLRSNHRVYAWNGGGEDLKHLAWVITTAHQINMLSLIKLVAKSPFYFFCLDGLASRVCCLRSGISLMNRLIKKARATANMANRKTWERETSRDWRNACNNS